MDYGSLIRRSWELAWRQKFLWVLGLFATSTVGSCSPSGGGGPAQYTAEPSDLDFLYSPDLEMAFEEIEPWLIEHVAGLALAVAGSILILVVVFFILSTISQGAMARATADLAMGRPTSLGAAWSVGRMLFWRYAVLWLVLTGLAILIAAGVAVAIGAGIFIASAVSSAARVVVIIVLVLGGVALVLVGIPLAIAASVVVAFAQRAIALEGHGPWEAVKTGLRLVRQNFGQTLLVWLINLALAIGAGIATFLVVMLLLIPLGGVGFIVYEASDVSFALFAYGVIAVLVLVAGLWFVGAAFNAFFWSYWTLAYLRFTGRLTERLEPAM